LLARLKSARFRKMHMIDLTSENVDKINGLIQKYAFVLELISDQEQIPYLAYIIDTAINYIKKTHNDLNIDWKSWCVILVKEQFLNQKIKSESDIEEIINDFIEYWKKEYKKYCDNIAISSSDYDRDRGFVYEYIWKKNQ
jgi:hypothetical protein